MTRSSRIVLLVLASVSIGLFVIAVTARVSFPYELTGVEALQPVVVQRLLAGLPLYAAPTPQYVGPVYTPLSFVLDAGLARAFGLNLPVLRVLSIASTLGIMLLVYGVLRAHQAERSIAAVCAAMLPAAHTRLGDCLDVARVDAPEVLFAVLAVAAGDFACRTQGRRSWTWTVTAACALGAAVLTKQTAATAAFGICLALWLVGRRAQAVGLALLVAGVVLSVGAALDAASGGWATFYLVTLPGRSPLVASDLALALARLALFFPGALAALALVVWRVRRGPPASSPLSAWEATLAFSVPAALFTNARFGGADNVWMIVVPLAAVVLGRYWAESAPRLSWRHLLFYPIALQAAVLPHRPIAPLPTVADRQTYEAFVAGLRQVPGPVFNPVLPYESMLAGHEPSPHIAQLVDYSSDAPVLNQLAAALRERRFATVIAGNPGDLQLPLFAGVEGTYRETQRFPVQGPAFRGVALIFRPSAP